LLTFLKLGGSLITNKHKPETPRADVIIGVAKEIKRALDDKPELSLLIGHGSGSFGHVAAREYGTRRGVHTAKQWQGFSEVSVVAARLNSLILEALGTVEIPVFRVQPSASLICNDGLIERMEIETINRALDSGLVPLVYGDVAFDKIRGGTIASTEEIFDYLAVELNPHRILLAGSYDAVLDLAGNRIEHIGQHNFDSLRPALGGSEATDVTGGMVAKVTTMLNLCKELNNTSIQIFSGETSRNIYDALTSDIIPFGTRISAK